MPTGRRTPGFRKWRARLLKQPLFNAQFQGRNFIIEGGGIEVNGRGTLLTTEECYLHPKIQVRNPGLTKAQYDETFKKYLGVKNVLWLRKGPAGDDTHGHIDDICRFVNRKTLVLIREKNKRDINYRAARGKLGAHSGLCGWKMAQNPKWCRCPCRRRFILTAAGCPRATRIFTSPMPASSSRRSTIQTTAIALGILGELFKDRPVVGIHAVDLVLGSGSLHCLTQQQPA